MTAKIADQGETMNTQIAEETTAAQPAAASQPKNAKRAPRRAPVAPKKGTTAKKATPAKKGRQARTKAKGARDGSKAAKILELLKRSGGATAKQLMKATGWQPHSVRGFLSGTLRKKMGLTVASVKSEEGERVYSVKA